MTASSSTSPDEPFPGLTAQQPGPLIERIRQVGWLDSDEQVEWAGPAGAGNMNLVLRVVTDRRSLIVKHARPWVEKYPQVAAPVERIESERQFYERAQELPAAAARMPRLLGFDSEKRLLALSDLGEAADLTGVYRGEQLRDDASAAVAQWAAALHEATRGRGEGEGALTNRAMRALNHEHIFEVPWQPGAVAAIGIDLDRFEPGLADAAATLQQDENLAGRAKQVGQRYLADGPCLLHGDLFPGSFLRSGDGIFAIDPEFAYFGEPEFDAGVWLGHLTLSNQPHGAGSRFLAAYREAAGGVTLDEARLAAYAACEVIRRLIGVAQLPIPPSNDGSRAALLERAATTLRSQALDALST